MSLDLRLVEKGRGQPRDALAQEGKVHVALANHHAAELDERRVGQRAGDALRQLLDRDAFRDGDRAQRTCPLRTLLRDDRRDLTGALLTRLTAGADAGTIAARTVAGR